MASTSEILTHGKDVLIGNYARIPIVMSRGTGSILHDSDGKEYIDLFAGFGGCILGHCQPELIAAATEQAARLWHVGNTYYSTPQIDFAEQLNRHAFKGQAFFCHSGLEANEAAVKLARLRGAAQSPAGDGGPHRWKIISLQKSFHGRSLAMIAATGNPAVKAGFAPAVPGFVQVEPGNIESLAAAIDDETAGVIIEPIQGEGGINLYPPDYASRVRALCDEKKLTLIFDEVWTGGGRTGRWFGYQHFAHADGSPVLPDILTLGKAIGGGLPVGAMFARPEVAALLVPGKHGCTLGGNPICLAVAAKIFEIIQRDGLCERAAVLGERAVARLRNESSIRSKVAGIRGRGLMLGIELKDAPEKFVEKALARGVVANVTAQKVVRLAPPLNIPDELFDLGLDRVVETIAKDVA